MKKEVMLTGLVILLSIFSLAQKKNYFSIESGTYFGNANKNIETNMIASHFSDDQTFDFFWLFSFDTKYPKKRNPRDGYRVRAGHFLNTKTGIEAGYGLSYDGTVEGYNNSTGSLLLTSHINSLYVAWLKSDSIHSVGFGIGPTVSFYKLTTEINKSGNEKTDNYLLPGMMITGYWNFIHKKSWFLGMRSEMSFTSPAKIKEFEISGSISDSKFRAMNSGSFNGSFTLVAGINL